MFFFGDGELYFFLASDKLFFYLGLRDEGCLTGVRSANPLTNLVVEFMKILAERLIAVNSA